MEKVLNYEPLDKDIVMEVMASLKDDSRDYVFSIQAKEKVIERCNESEISIIYTTYYDKYGSFDYVEFIPVIFKRTPTAKRKNSPKLANLQIDMKLIKEDKDNWIYEDKSRFKEAKRKKSKK